MKPVCAGRVSIGLLILMGLGLFVRLGLIVADWKNPMADPDLYLQIAGSMARGDGYVLQGRPTAYRPPLYPISLVPAFLIEAVPLRVSVMAWNLAMGVLTILLTGLAMQRVGAPSVPTLLAAGLVAFDPVLVSQAREVMTETMAATLVALVLWLVSAKPSYRISTLAGIASGLAALCRPSLLPATGLIAVLDGWRSGGSPRVRIARSMLFLSMTVLTMAPWAIRNALVFGEPVWTTTHGGYTLALANNPIYYAEVLNGPPGAVWSGPNQEAWFREINRRAEAVTEPEADRLYYREGWRMLRERPLDFLRASGTRLARFWAIAPSPQVYPALLRWATAAWTVPFWGLAIFSILSGRWRRWPAPASSAFILALTLAHTIYWTDLRMRAPLVPSLALVAAMALWRRNPCLESGVPVDHPAGPSERMARTG